MIKKMANDFIEEKILELTRKGDMEKAKFLKNLHKRIMPSQFERIQKNDKSVYRELFMPKWVTWETLRAWADNFKLPGKGKTCILCNNKSENGIDFNERFICENCFVRLKHLE